MELVQFHDRIYGKYKSLLFTFESTWDSFRPIHGVGWNGKQIVPISGSYTSDIFDENYGFGSLQMKALCRQLTQDTELGDAREVKDPIQLWRWYSEKNVKWWRDRPVVYTSACVDTSPASWKEYLKYLETRAKTLRHPFKGRQTRRNLVAK